eukprot:10549947-Prorocentrum_lima.AAC.1
MTSSLVGSEMCIRDSRHAMPAAAHEVERLSPICEVAEQLSPVVESWWKHCLLYTSDAADDM